MKVNLNKVVKKAPAPEVRPEPVQETKKPIVLEVSEIEEGLSIPRSERGSIYDFGLDEMNENQSRFVALPQDIARETFRAAIYNAITKAREAREYRQNFVMRDASKDGKDGIRIFCVSMDEKPMRKNAKVMQEQAA